MNNPDAVEWLETVGIRKFAQRDIYSYSFNIRPIFEVLMDHNVMRCEVCMHGIEAVAVGMVRPLPETDRTNAGKVDFAHLQ